MCNTAPSAANECDYNFTTATVKTNVGDLTLTYTAGTSVTDGTNTAATKALSSASSPAFTDGAAPIYVSSTTIDNNGNATADYVRIVYSEAILDSSVLATDFQAGVADTTAGNLGETYASLTPSSGYLTDSADDEVIYIGVTNSGETITALDTDAVLKIEQTGSITEAAAAANTLATFSLQTSTDGMAPQIITATYQDTDVDGKVDQITLAFSETLDAASTLAQENLTLTVGDFTSAAFGTAAVDLVAAVASVAIPLGTEASVIDTFEDAGTIAITSADGGTITFSLTDGTNENTTPKAEAQITFADGAAPQIENFGYQDSDADGKIDRISVVYSESVVSSSVLSGSNFIFSDVGDFTGAAFESASIDLITITVASTNVELLTESTVVDTYDGSGTIAITSQDHEESTFTLTDSAGNINTTPKAEAQATFLDQSKPVIKSSSPTDASTAQSRTNDISWTFSEPITSGGGWVHASEFTSDPDPGNWGTAAWSVGDTVVTASHANLLCVTTYSITTDDTVIAATNGESGYTALNDASTAPIGTALTFTTMSCSSSSSGGGGGGGSSKTTYSVSLDNPAPTGTLNTGKRITIEWESSPEGQYYVSLYYVDEDGEYVEIIENTQNDGKYDWVVPDISVTNSAIYIVWTDLSDTLDTATSDEFSIVLAGESDDSSDDTDDSGSSSMGTNPFTGEEESIDDVSIGDFITSPETDAVYYVDIGWERRPFINSQAYFTWADSWSEVTEVTGATLASLTLGDPMLPKAGVTMVKIQSDAKTYVIEGDNTLRWVVSEEVATDLYGSSWNAYIIDIEPTFFSRFEVGADVEDASDYSGLDGVTKKTRELLSQ